MDAPTKLFGPAHPSQIADVMARLCAARSEEEARGVGAANARRWNMLKSVVHARTMLKTVFRSAADHAAQVAVLSSPSAMYCHQTDPVWLRSPSL